MSAPHRHVPRNLLLGTLLAGGIMACGQRGPLELPEQARPIQRIEVPQPPPRPQSQPPEKQDDEQKKNER